MVSPHESQLLLASRNDTPDSDLNERAGDQATYSLPEVGYLVQANLERGFRPKTNVPSAFLRAICGCFRLGSNPCPPRLRGEIPRPKTGQLLVTFVTSHLH